MATISPRNLVLVRRRMSPRLRLIYGLAIVLTLGVLLPILAMLWALAWWLDDAPVVFDTEGLVTRRARRIGWRDVVSSRVQAEHLNRYGRLVLVRWSVLLETSAGRIHFQPDLYTNGAAGLAYLECALGTTFAPPR